MKIGEVSKLPGIPVSAIRFYEEQGLLQKAARVSGKREFSANTVPMLRFVRIAQDAGFKISEIKGLVSGIHCEAELSKRWRELAAVKIAEMDALIEKANAMKEILKKGLSCKCMRIEDCVEILNPT